MGKEEEEALSGGKGWVRRSGRMTFLKGKGEEGSANVSCLSSSGGSRNQYYYVCVCEREKEREKCRSIASLHWPWRRKERWGRKRGLFKASSFCGIIVHHALFQLFQGELCELANKRARTE